MFRALLAVVVGAVALPAAAAGPAVAGPGPYSGGPTHYFTSSNGEEIALSVVLPEGYEEGKQYPTILEMAGYENGSASADGRTMSGQTKDFLCAQSPDPDQCPEEEPPLADDSFHGTSAFRYHGDYVVVHASLQGTGCSSGEFSLYNRDHARAGAELIDDWIPEQEWSNGKVGLLGHSYSGATATLIASHQPEHLVAMTVSGLVDDNYRGITFPGGVLNSLFPPLWYLGIRNAYHVVGGSGQGIVRNADNSNGQRCAANSASHTVDVDNDPIVNGVMAQGRDGEYWRRVSLITYIDRINVPIHITGTFNDEQTGARGFAHLWERVRPGLPKRLLQMNGNHDTNVVAREAWADRKAWMDHWMRGVSPDPSWGMTRPDGRSIKPASIRTLFEVHPDEEELVSNGHHDATTWPLNGTRWSTYLMCSGKTLTTESRACDEGSDTYLSGSKRQSWLYQAGSDAGPPLTSEDGPDQVSLRGPVVRKGDAWAMAGPIIADLRLSVAGNESDLFVQVADEDTTTGETLFLTRGWLKASHRAIDAELSDYTNVDPTRRGFMYRPYRHHAEPEPVPPNEPIDYRIEVWPTAHVFRPGHRLVVIVTAPPAVDSNYSFATQTNQPASVNTLHYDPSHPSSITVPVLPAKSIAGLGSTGPGCGDYWQVRCTRS